MQTRATESSSAGSCDPFSEEVALCNLPPFSAAAVKCLQIAEQPDVDLRNIQSIVASDPSLAAEMLRLANSPLFAFATEIRSVEHAVVLLGLHSVRAICVAIALKSYWSDVDQAVYRQCWSHSIACAVIAEELADLYSIRKEDAYTAGLLHDIGRVGLLKSYPGEYLPLLTAKYKKLEEGLTTEHWAMRMDHCQAGSWLAKAWTFPVTLQRVTEQHHTEVDAGDSPIVNLTRVTCLVAGAIGFSELNCEETVSLDGISAGLKDTVAPRVFEHINEIKQHIVDRIDYF